MSVIPSITLTKWLRYAVCFSAVVAMTITAGSLEAAYCDTGANSTNLIGNCGFETSPITASWAISGSVTLYNGTNPPQAPNGDTRSAGISITSGVSSIKQNIVGLVAGTTYNVQFQYLTGSVSGASFAVKDSLNANVLSTILSATGPTTWSAVQTYQFTATSNIPYNINFALSGSSAALLLVDNVIVSAVPVPEPSSMILLGSLCSAIVGYKYKRKVS